MNGNAKVWIAFATLATLLVTALISQDRSIHERLTRDEVEHVVDYKVYDKLAEIKRQLDSIEHKLADQR